MRLEHLDELSALLPLAQLRELPSLRLLFCRQPWLKVGQRGALERPGGDGGRGCRGRRGGRGGRGGGKGANRLEQGEEMDGGLVVEQLSMELA